MKYANSELVSQLAAEYVLGTLRGPARARFESLLKEREDFRQQIEYWEQRLGLLLEKVGEIPPPPTAWERISARVAPIATVQKERGMVERLGFWKRVAGTAVAALVIMIGVVLWPGSQNPSDAGYVVLLHDDSQGAVWVINALPDLAELDITAAASPEVPAGKSCYLWVRPKASDRLFALGLLPESGSSQIRVRDELRPFLPGDLLVSMEDTGATPPEAPTEPMDLRAQWTRALGSL